MASQTDRCLRSRQRAFAKILTAQPLLEEPGPVAERGIALAQACAVGPLREDVEFRRQLLGEQRLIKPDHPIRPDQRIRAAISFS